MRWETERSGDTPGTPAGEAIDLRHDMDEAFARLSPQQRSLLWLAHVEGYRHDEIAEMLDLREKSIKVLLFRARHKLKEALAAIGIGESQ